MGWYFGSESRILGLAAVGSRLVVGAAVVARAGSCGALGCHPQASEGRAAAGNEHGENQVAAPQRFEGDRFEFAAS